MIALHESPRIQNSTDAQIMETWVHPKGERYREQSALIRHIEYFVVTYDSDKEEKTTSNNKICVSLVRMLEKSKK